MWEISAFSQLTGLGYAIILGAIYCAVYDFLRAVRATGSTSFMAVFIQDFLFLVFTAVTCFCFLLSITGGEARAYILIGIASGFLIFRLTISKILFFLNKKIIFVIRIIFSKITLFLNTVFNFINKVIDYSMCGLPKHFKSFYNTFKKGLKKVYGLLYTNHNK